MTQKFYLHDATSADTGTLPGATTLSGRAVTITATGAATNKAMDGTIGTLQTSVALTTSAVTTNQSNWFRRFVSPPLAAQSIAGGSWTFEAAWSEANANSNLSPSVYAAVWRPSTGVKVADLISFSIATTAEPGTTQTVETITANSAAVTLLDGDILVFEVWGNNTQAKATGYANTFFYDGTTALSVTSEASFLQSPVDLPLQGGGAATKPQVINNPILQAVPRSHSW